MSTPATPLDVGRMRRLLRTRTLGHHCDYSASLDSTNERALELAGPSGLVVVADHQTAGRGRDGAAWEAPRRRALLLSVLVDPVPWRYRVSLTFAAGVALCATATALGVAAHIKWPNDLLVGRRKLAGILCESRVRGDAIGPMVVGIGLNVNQPADELPAGATSCRVELGHGVDRESSLAALLNRLEVEVAAVIEGRRAEVFRRWEEMSVLHQGHDVLVPQGDDWVRGETDGIDADGSLRVVAASGERLRVVSGGVRFL